MLPTVAAHVLIADNDDIVAGVLVRYLEGRGHRVERCTNGRDALRCIRDGAFDVALLDSQLPELDGLDVLRRTREDPFPPECIITSEQSTIDTAVAALRSGASDYLAKPYRLDEIDIMVRRAAEKRRSSRDTTRMQRRLLRMEAPHALDSAALSMQAALVAAARAAQSHGSVLIVGEPGTGKSTVARYLHQLSPRSAGPMVEVNCDLLDPQRARAALFSTLADAADAADTQARAFPRTVGALEEAAGGTVIFCDVEWLDQASQAALAEVLAAGEYCRDGADARLSVDARVIATTLTVIGEQHEIRADLLQQLSGELIALPTLRARAADIVPIAERYVRDAASHAAHVLTDAAIAALLKYHWPGNLRELRAVITRAVAIAPKDVIDAKHLMLPPHAGLEVTSPEDDSLDAMEWRHIQVVLGRVGGHQGRAAARLGISSKTLYRKIRQYGVPRSDIPGSI